MKSEDVKKLFPEATKEQIDELLDINGTDLKAAKKDEMDPEELKSLQERAKKFDELEAADLTDAEKIQKELEASREATTKYLKELNKLEVEKILVKAGIESEDYSDFIDDLIVGDTEKSKALATNMVNVVAKKTEAAIQKTKEELMDGTKSPDGSGGSNGEEKSEDVKFAEDVAGSFATSTDGSKAVFDNY